MVRCAIHVNTPKLKGACTSASSPSPGPVSSSPSPFPPFQVDRAAGSGSIRKSNKRGKTREAVVVAVGPIQAKEVPLLAFVAVSAALNFGQGTPPPFRHVAFAL
jgi:hypothetical protein